MLQRERQAIANISQGAFCRPLSSSKSLQFLISPRPPPPLLFSLHFITSYPTTVSSIMYRDSWSPINIDKWGDREWILPIFSLLVLFLCISSSLTPRCAGSQLRSLSAPWDFATCRYPYPLLYQKGLIQDEFPCSYTNKSCCFLFHSVVNMY